MITLKQWFETVDYRITEGADYTWRCYGPHAHVLDSWNGEQDGQSFSVVFDTKTQEVYEVQAHDYQRGRAYRWFNSGCQQRFEDECKTHNSVEDEAWEGVSYVTLEVAEDWMEKARAIATGEDYDTRVQVPIDFSDEELLKYMKLAHERDMTFNEFVEEALRFAIEEHKLALED
jgi:hypothetical protein